MTRMLTSGQTKTKRPTRATGNEHRDTPGSRRQEHRLTRGAPTAADADSAGRSPAFLGLCPCNPLNSRRGKQGRGARGSSPVHSRQTLTRYARATETAPHSRGGDSSLSHGRHTQPGVGTGVAEASTPATAELSAASAYAGRALELGGGDGRTSEPPPCSPCSLKKPPVC